MLFTGYSLGVKYICTSVRNLELSNRPQADKGSLKKNKVGFVNIDNFPGC